MKILKFSALLVFLASAVMAQTQKDIFNPSTKIIWLGLDFSGAKFIGDTEKFIDVQKTVLMWNSLMDNEPDKYDVGQALDRGVLERHIDVTIDHNKSMELTSILSNNHADLYHLGYPELGNIVSSYDFKGLHGIGVMFIVDSFSKPQELSSIWVTFVNMDSKKVILAERLTSKPAGFGLRNYWAGAIHLMLKNMHRKEYDAWKKKYNS